MKKQALHLKPIPERMKLWLDLIRDIESDNCELPEWEILGDALTAETVKSWDEKLSALPKTVQRFIRLDDQDKHAESDWISRREKYLLIKGALAAFHRIAKFSVRVGKDETYVSLLMRQVKMRLDDLLPMETGYIIADEARIIHFELSPVLAALEDVEADRIRECENPKCKRIYWAGRKDQRCCCKKCANSQRVQKHRDKKDKYKYNRYLNEERKRHGTV